MSNDLVIFAAFWNEGLAVRKSLMQIDTIQPAKVYISEGCFDNAREARSTDDTRLKIQDWAVGRKNVTLIEPVRRSWLRHMICDLERFRQGGYGRGVRAFMILLRRLTTSTYRLNQSETFNEMLLREQENHKDFWFMTYDADEFLSEDALVSLRALGTLSEIDMVAFREVTIVHPNYSVAPWYPTTPFRTWNVPVRFSAGMLFVFTREIFGFRPDSDSAFVRFANIARVALGGDVYHYKIDHNRIRQGIELGNRRKPEEPRTRAIPFLPGVLGTWTPHS